MCRAVTLLLLLLAGCPARAAADHAAFTEQVWHTDHGLPQHTVQAITQTRAGYLWVGTRFGLARFDGVRFLGFGPTTHRAFGDGSVSALAEGADGTLWIGTYEGLLALRGREVARVDGVPTERIWALHAGTDGVLWLGLARGVGRWDGREFSLTPLTGADGAEFQVRSLAPHPEGGLVVAGLEGVAWFDPAAGTARPWFPAVAAKAGPAAEPAAPPDAGWVTRPAGTEAAHGGDAGFRRLARSRGRNAWGPRLTPDGDGGWWLLDSERRLFHLGANGPVQLVARDPRVAEVLCVRRDREGSVWLGTTVGGLVRLRPAVFATHPLGAGDDGPCFTVVTDTEGAVWAANQTAVVRFHAGGRAEWRLFGSEISGQIKTLLPARRGGLWIGRDREGVFLWHTGRLEPLDYAAGPRHLRVRALLETRDGALWIGSRGGLSRWQDGAVRHFDGADGLARADVGAVHEAADGTLWAGMDGGGVARLEGGRFRSFGPGDGLAGDTVWGFLEEADGTLWLYGRGGLTRWRGGRFAAVTPAHGLFDELNNQMLADGTGHYWLGCNRGIYRVRTHELHAVADGRADRLTAVHFGASDGLPVAETNGENQPAGAVTRDGALWFPTPVGVVCVDPARLPGHEPPPQVILEAVRTEAGSVLDEAGLNPALPRRADGAPRLPPGTARVVEFEYTAASLAAPERVRFRHRLAGHEAAWTEAGARRSTHYTNLRPGAYVFEVLAANHHGVWAVAPARFAFTVMPAFHQTVWFPAVLAGALAGAALGLHRLRLRLVRRRLALEGELGLARERARIARDMHDDVGANLTRIALLTERARAVLPAPDPLLDRIAEATRASAQAMDEIVWAVNPGNDRLESLADYVCQLAREQLEPAGLRLHLDVPVRLPATPVPSDVRHHLVRVLKEALHNAVRHAGATQVTVRFVFEAGEIVLAVTDDGRGFRPEAAAGDPGRPGGGHGLGNLHRRVEALGGRLAIHSAPGQGTTVEVRVRSGLPGPGVRGG